MYCGIIKTTNYVVHCEYLTCLIDKINLVVSCSFELRDCLIQNYDCIWIGRIVNSNRISIRAMHHSKSEHQYTSIAPNGVMLTLCKFMHAIIDWHFYWKKSYAFAIIIIINTVMYRSYNIHIQLKKTFVVFVILGVLFSFRCPTTCKQVYMLLCCLFSCFDAVPDLTHHPCVISN